MNTKQMEIAKKMGGHIACLNSLYEEFQSANDEPLEKPPMKIKKQLIRKVLKQVIGFENEKKLVV
jgi:hypothetical protein